MKYQLNNGIIKDLPDNAVIAIGSGNYESEIDLGDEFYRYDLVDGEFVIARSITGWHDETSTIQIKLIHIDNARMLKRYPDMAVYGSALQCFIEEEFVYLYCNYVNDTDTERLLEFNAEIKNKTL